MFDWLKKRKKILPKGWHRDNELLDEDAEDIDGAVEFAFPPSTERLFTALEIKVPRRTNEEQARDPYIVWSALSQWENVLYGRLPEEQYSNGTWPVTHQQVEALRAALKDQKGNYAGSRLAYTLVRCGCRELDTISGLCAWDAQLFRWKSAGLSAEDMLRKFRSVGIEGNPSPTDLQRLDEWLADPAAVLAHYSSGNLCGTLLAGRTFSANLYSNEMRPDYAELLRRISAHAVPALPISNVSQQSLAGAQRELTERTRAEISAMIPNELKGMPIVLEGGVTWQIEFDFESVRNAIHVAGDFSRLNDVDVICQFNRLLERLGRTDRVMKFGPGRNESDSVGQYILADRGLFMALCDELHIPLA